MMRDASDANNEGSQAHTGTLIIEIFSYLSRERL